MLVLSEVVLPGVVLPGVLLPGIILLGVILPGIVFPVVGFRKSNICIWENWFGKALEFWASGVLQNCAG